MLSAAIFIAMPLSYQRAAAWAAVCMYCAAAPPGLSGSARDLSTTGGKQRARAVLHALESAAACSVHAIASFPKSTNKVSVFMKFVHVLLQSGFMIVMRGNAEFRKRDLLNSTC
jgi:hypothetical protein